MIIRELVETVTVTVTPTVVDDGPNWTDKLEAWSTFGGAVGTIATIAITAWAVMREIRKTREDREEAAVAQALNVFGRLIGMQPAGLTGDHQVREVYCRIENLSDRPILWARAVFTSRLPGLDVWTSPKTGRIASKARHDRAWTFDPIRLDADLPPHVSIDTLPASDYFDVTIEFADANGAIWFRNGDEKPRPASVTA